MDLSELRAWWSHRQGLDGSLAGCAPAEVLERSGWARSVGGVGPYLTLFARAGVTREAADKAVAKLAIHELPAARGCTYVVPACDFALALRAGQGAGDGGDIKAAAKLGVTAKEIDKLCGKVLAALGAGTLDPEGLREAVGGAARSLGEEGKKKGLTTTLPLALGRLQSEGEIRRVPKNGRLDQQRYSYALWRPNPLSKFKLAQEEVHAELARRYFRWIGPATRAQFQGFSGLGVKAAKLATESLGLVAAPGGEERWMLSEDLDALRSFKAPKKPQMTLVSSLDGLALLRRDLKSLIAPADGAHNVMVDKSYASMGGLMDLPSHGIFDRGRLVGLWEYDPSSESLAWTAFVPRTRELAAAVKMTESFVREQLGDARSFSLDSPKSRMPRIEALRRAG